jgi:hypothetical protein
MIPTVTIAVEQLGCEVPVAQALAYCDSNLYGALVAGILIGSLAVIVTYRLGLWYRAAKNQHD